MEKGKHTWWRSRHQPITSGLCCAYILVYPPLLPSTAHLYSYQQRYLGSLYPFDIVSLYRFSLPSSSFKDLFLWTLFDLFHVTYRKLAMSYFHYHEWLFLYSWFFKHFEEIVLYHNWYYQHIIPFFIFTWYLKISVKTVCQPFHFMNINYLTIENNSIEDGFAWKWRINAFFHQQSLGPWYDFFVCFSIVIYDKRFEQRSWQSFFSLNLRGNFFGE